MPRRFGDDVASAGIGARGVEIDRARFGRFRFRKFGQRGFFVLVLEIDLRIDVLLL